MSSMVTVLFLVLCLFTIEYMDTIGFNCIGITWVKNKWVEFPFMALDSGLCNFKGLTVLTVIHVQMYPTSLRNYWIHYYHVFIL